VLPDGISVVIPVYNSEGSVRPLVERLEKVLPSLADEWEIILVNDGSRDGSWSVVRELAVAIRHVRGINFMRNYGQHNALLAGIRAARFAITVTMDDDLQHPPEEIPKLLDALAQGYDVVYGTPMDMQHGVLRNLASKSIKAALARAMRVERIVDINAFRAFRSRLREAFVSYESPHAVLDVLLSWATIRFAAVRVQHQPRAQGRSNYSVRKLFEQALLILTGFSTGPLRIASSLGFVFTLFGIVILGWVLIRYILEGGSVPGFPFLASIIAIFSGAQLFTVGIIGEYLARIFNRSMQRPLYVIMEQVGDD
jgi:glycosyltransferase involved in cell wall biosynthesis